VFLTIKQAILKQIKEHQLDALIAVLRERKFARIHTQSAGLDFIVRRLANNLKNGRERMIKRFRGLIYKVRAVGCFRKHIKNRYGPRYERLDHDLKIHHGWVIPTITCIVPTIRGAVIERAQKTLRAFLHAKSRGFFAALKFKHTVKKVEGIQNAIRK
jgi:hypothetical protein